MFRGMTNQIRKLTGRIISALRAWEGSEMRASEVTWEIVYTPAEKFRGLKL